MNRGVRLAAGVVGAGIIGSVVHAAIMASGDYDTTSSPLTISLACGLVVGAVVLGRCWHGRRGFAALIVLGLFAGEGWALILTAERTLAHREMRQAPLADAAKKRAEAKQKAEEAEAALANMNEPQRLIDAMEAKRSADQDVTDKAALKTCVQHCKDMLQTKVAGAKQEIEAARAEFAQLKADAERKAREARAYYNGLQVPPSASPLADRLGVAGWIIDLIAAVLASIAANGLGAVLVAFAAHGRRQEPVRVIAARAVAVVSSDPIEALPKCEPRDAEAEANKFACTMFRPDPGGSVRLDDIRAAYHEWSREQGREPLPNREIGAALNSLFAGVGLECRDRAIHGIRWSDKVPAVIAA